jgi:hypothetical protein
VQGELLLVEHVLVAELCLSPDFLPVFVSEGLRSQALDHRKVLHEIFNDRSLVIGSLSCIRIVVDKIFVGFEAELLSFVYSVVDVDIFHLEERLHCPLGNVVFHLVAALQEVVERLELF